MKSILSLVSGSAAGATVRSRKSEVTFELLSPMR
jgi:hypothetical protein